MYKISDRCMMLRDEMVNLKTNMKHYYAQRHFYFTAGEVLAAEKDLGHDEIIGSGISYTLRKFTPYIAPGELVVGFNFGDAQYGDGYMPDFDDEQVYADNNIDEETIEICKRRDSANRKYYWDYFNHKLDFTDTELKSKNEWAAYGRYIDANHSVLGYEKVLKLGFEGLLKETEKYEKINGSNSMYRAIKDICLAACDMGKKYADKAEELLNSGDEAYNPEDLKIIIKTCKRVPKYPAETFMEAVQALWFAHIINTWEDWVNANSLGHLDQILYPYYKNDIEKGLITKEEAFEIICCLWLKLYRDYDVQQSCLGGTSVDGESLENDLSYMMLDVTEQLDFIRCLSVRFSEKSNKAFLRRALEVVGHVQKGVPFFFNDDFMIPALIDKGISKEDAHNYTQIGCVETVIPGKSNPHAVTGEMNVLKALEYVLCNGYSMCHPEYKTGIETGTLDKFTTFELFYDAVLKQVDYILDLTCSQVKKYHDVCVENCISPRPYKSLLTEGCLESGKGFNEDGAVYDYYQVMIGGLPNLADSLIVIKKFVYDEKKYTLEELKEILENNYPDESVRQEFINKASKFGNDIAEVDDIAVDVLNRACDDLDMLSEKYSLSFHAQPFTFLWMLEHGEHCSASPDGRKSGEPIAYSVSPMQGRDFNGLTAVLNSISKFPTKRTAGTTSAIVEVDPKLFTDRNIDALTDILIASGKKGLSNVQFNTVDAETLIDAKKNPDKYTNLAVRVSGFSQKFNLLSPALQDHIIGRTKHKCL